ncbi:MAG: ATP-dependent DNA helicase RecG [Lysobacterales bacterium 69-70]|nr:ATP-dependent DNA helicase RecG [Xanthomonadaceae bacterium]ODU35276.1 MAG: ATP-dependent DNA helicase RecG [Xanthomonadaceae bacterium SCN 69-320]ODV17258.1 MAG: ATP-dependent DNA helicase RecG [Xanthomonadaceae bacterium SCN 69-25]OJY94174.1 MAG: ATP-dependent DNA helicase RecG [Xanthomonadales bacterium 69-70]
MPTEAGLQPLTGLPGVGPALRETLARLGMTVLQDLWFHLPLRYEDRTRLVPIADLREGESAQVEGIVDVVQRGFRGRPQLRVALSDGSQETLVLRFFHFRGAQADQLKPGARLRCYGEVRRGQNSLEMVHPQYQRLVDDATSTVEENLTPVYPTTEGLGQRRLGSLIQHALQRLPDDDALELIPDSLRAGLELASLREALLFVHRPPPDANVAQLLAGVHPAQQRLAFEELLSHHLSLRQLRNTVRRQAAPALAGDGHLRRRLLAALPYALTGAQRRVGAEIAADLRGSEPMLRLVQGDVGSGKTVVAALAALSAVEAGHQAALMAPTELLAEQHLRTLRGWLEPLGVEVVWLAGKVQGRARKAALDAVAGGAGVVVGTHALMQEGVAFRQLGLAIIDEQHRFGVHQRLALRDKGREGERVPHQLVLTATPIPRTLAMTAYADLDVSVIDQLPPGRTPVTTVVVANGRRAEVIARIRAACLQGHQAYWVCTLIEETELLQAQAAEVTHVELSAALPELKVGLVHGRLKPKEKTALMDAFKAGEIAVLVATTVIEVGVDVPNASLMIIENAERLGLAQLHQLRGRVGRGHVASNCVLLYQPPLSPLARARLEVMRETSDGFRIAEKDLELRGPGEMLGTRQTGRLEFRIADIRRDAALLPDVQRIGEALLGSHAGLADRIVARWIGASARYAGA